MLLIVVACVIANYAPECETWWWSRTRPAVTFAGNTFEDRELAYVAGVPLFAELTMKETREATIRITRAYRIMGYLRARIGIERSVTNRGWATCFVIDEGKHYLADEVSERLPQAQREATACGTALSQCFPGREVLRDDVAPMPNLRQRFVRLGPVQMKEKDP